MQGGDKRRWAVAALCAAMTAGLPAGQGRASAPVKDLPVQTTEEGQSVIYDGYTWQRRELAKKLPLNEPWPSEAVIEAQFKRFNLDKPPVAEPIEIPTRIIKDVYLVNSKSNLTYLIDAGPAGLVIVDPGLEENVEPILQNIARLGFPRSAVRWVINTHAHYDHSMADAHFQRLGAKILVGREDVPAVEKGTQVTAKFVLPAAQRDNYPTLKVDWPVDDGEELKLGDKVFYAISTPGHTSGSTCYLLVIDHKNILFGGDSILFDYRLGAQGTAYADNNAYLTSLRKVARFFAFPVGRVRWDVLLPGHGTMVMDRAYLDVMKDLKQVEWDVNAGEQVKALPFADDDYRKLMFGRP